MDNNEYREKGKEVIDFIGDYLRDIRHQRVFPNVSPGYMRKLLPDTAPTQPESWDQIMDDIKNVILPGVTHWQSPYMHAYFPALNSYPSLLGDMIADAINCLGFTWASSPACTELETIVMDWLGKMIGMPNDFLHSNTQTAGGGVIQTTASEATFISVLAARTEAIRKVQELYPEKDDSEINGRLIAYCSDQAHSSVEKAGLIGLVRMRYLATDNELSLRGKTLKEAIDDDRAQGFIPFYLCATLGTTGACAFDVLTELGPICKDEEVYLHIDAAYAGSAFICPEFRVWMKGVEYAQSFAFNPSKWLMVHFDCTAMWIKDSTLLHRTFNVDPLYLQHENSGEAIDYMHWQIGLSKRFRALKLWCVLRSFGIAGLQAHIRRGVELAKLFESLVLSNPNFEIPAKRHMGMVVFRLKGENELTETLLKSLNSSGKLHMVPASLKGVYIIRFTVTSQYTTENDIRRDWLIISAAAREVVIKLGGLWLEEVEEEIEVEISDEESGLGEDQTNISTKDSSSVSQDETASRDTIETDKLATDKNTPSSTLPTDQRKSVQFKDVSEERETSLSLPYGKKVPSKSLASVMPKTGRHFKKIPHKQMSVIFDPRASARRRATELLPYDDVLGAERNKIVEKMTESEYKKNKEDRRGSGFGVSLLLSNTPHSPQFINGSYAAIFENPQVVNDIAQHLRRLQTEDSPLRQGPSKANVPSIEISNTINEQKDVPVGGNESDYEKSDVSFKSGSSALFKQAIANLFEKEKSVGTVAGQMPSDRSGTTPSSNSLMSARQKRFKNRQYSLDSRLNYFSRAISDINAAAKAISNQQQQSENTEGLETQNETPRSDSLMSISKLKGKTLTETPEEQEEEDNQDDASRGPNPNFDYDREKNISRNSLDENTVPQPNTNLDDPSVNLEYESNESGKGKWGQSVTNESLRRRRRIMNSPISSRPTATGGVGASTLSLKDLEEIGAPVMTESNNLKRVSLSSSTGGLCAPSSPVSNAPYKNWEAQQGKQQDNAVQVEDCMLPFEDAPYTSPFITSPTYKGPIGGISNEVGTICNGQFLPPDSPNDKRTGTNFRSPWGKLKNRLIAPLVTTNNNRDQQDSPESNIVLKETNLDDVNYNDENIGTENKNKFTFVKPYNDSLGDDLKKSPKFIYGEENTNNNNNNNYNANPINLFPHTFKNDNLSYVICQTDDILPAQFEEETKLKPSALFKTLKHEWISPLLNACQTTVKTYPNMIQKVVTNIFNNSTSLLKASTILKNKLKLQFWAKENSHYTTYDWNYDLSAYNFSNMKCKKCYCQYTIMRCNNASTENQFLNFPRRSI